jgi:hypothetical protein
MARVRLTRDLAAHKYLPNELASTPCATMSTYLPTPFTSSSLSAATTVHRRESTTNKNNLVKRIAGHIAGLITISASNYKPQIVKIHNVPPQVFKDCKTELLAHPTRSVAEYFETKLFYEYNQKLKEIIVTFESVPHEGISRFLSRVMNMIGSSDFVPSDWVNKLTELGSPSKLLSFVISIS